MQQVTQMGLFGLGFPELALVAGAAAILFGASPARSCCNMIFCHTLPSSRYHASTDFGVFVFYFQRASSGTRRGLVSKKLRLSCMRAQHVNLPMGLDRNQSYLKFAAGTHTCL